MQEILQGNAALIEALGALCTRDKAIHHSTDAYGNAFHWFRLDHPRFMSQAATALQGAHARLCMITAYNLKQLGEQQQENDGDGHDRGEEQRPRCGLCAFELPAVFDVVTFR